MRSGRVLRQIVMNRIIAQVPALGGRVYDKATEDVAYPYATMGPSYWTDDSTSCFEGREITLQVDVWGKATNKGVVEDVTDDVASALRGYANEVALTMHPIEIDTARVTDDPDGMSVHGIVVVRAMIEG